jgi:hypothetical protein
LWELDQRLAALQRERVSLIAALRGQQPSEAPADERPAPAPAPATRRTWTTQQTVLAVGVLLVLVASSIALAIAWFVIGRIGQMVVMGGFTIAAAATALHLSRRRLPSSAEALSLVAGGLILLDVAAARRFGLAGLDSVDARTYAAVTGLLVAVVLATVHRHDRRIAGFAILSLSAASIGWAAVVGFADSAAGVAGLALAGAVLFGIAHLLIPASFGLTRRAATGPAAGWSAVSLAAATVGALAAAADAAGDPNASRLDDLTLDGLACVGLLAVLAATGAVVTRRVVAVRTARLGGRAAVRTDWTARPLSGDWRALGVVALVATAAVPTAVLALALQLGAFWTALLAVLAGVLATGLAVARSRTTSLGTAWCEAQTALAMGVLVLVTLAQDSRPATIAALTATALAATTAAVHRVGWRLSASAVAALAAVGAVTLGGGLVSTAVGVLAAAGAGSVLVAGALARRSRPEEVSLAAVGHLALAGALLGALASERSDGVVIAVLTAIALAATTTGVLRSVLRAPAAGVAAVASAWALWLSGGLVGPQTQWALLFTTGLLLVALAVSRLTHPEEVVLALLAALVGVAAVTVALDRSWPHAAAGAAAAYGLVAVGYAALPHRRAVVTLAVVGLTTATWLELAHADVTTLEAWTLPPAGLLLAAGIWSRRELGNHSWLTSGPGLAVALLPSALFTTVDDGVVRPLVTVSVAAVVLVVGAQQRRQALVVLGATAAVIIAITQLGPYAVQLPRYLTLGALGVALLAVGARYEQRRADARQAVSWLASMS